MSQGLHRTSSVIRYALTYAVWLLTCALGVGVVWTWRSALLGLFIRLRLDKYAYAAYNNVVVLALILGCLILVILSESWCRVSAKKGRLTRLVARLDGCLAVSAVTGYVLVLVGL